MIGGRPGPFGLSGADTGIPNLGGGAFERCCYTQAQRRLSHERRARGVCAHKNEDGMKVLYFRWVNVRMAAGLLWWAIKLPHARFVPHLLGFCRAIIEDAESRNPAIKADHEARRANPTTH